MKFEKLGRRLGTPVGGSWRRETHIKVLVAVYLYRAVAAKGRASNFISGTADKNARRVRPESYEDCEPPYPSNAHYGF